MITFQEFIRIHKDCLRNVQLYIYQWCMNMPDILLTKDWNDFLTHFVVYLYQEYGLNTHKSFDV